MSVITTANNPHISYIPLTHPPAKHFFKTHTPAPNDCQNPKKEKSLKYSRLGHLGSIILEHARKISEFAQNTFFANFKIFHDGVMQVREIMKFSNFFDVAILPFIVVSIAEQAKHIFTGKRSAKIDAAIQMIAELGSLGRSLTIVSIGIAGLYKVSEKVMNWTSSLFLATSVLSSVSMANTYRTYLKMRKFEKKFVNIAQLDSKHNETSLETFQKALKYIKDKEIKDKDFVIKAFSCLPQKLDTRLAEIEKEATDKIASAKLEDQQEGRQLLNKTLKTLKGHIHFVGNKSRLSVIISAVSLIAAIVLFACPPIAPLTYAFAGLGIALNLGKLIHQKVVEYRYTKSLGLQKNFFEWIIC